MQGILSFFSALSVLDDAAWDENRAMESHLPLNETRSVTTLRVGVCLALAYSKVWALNAHLPSGACTYNSCLVLSVSHMVCRDVVHNMVSFFSALPAPDDAAWDKNRITRSQQPFNETRRLITLRSGVGLALAFAKVWPGVRNCILVHVRVVVVVVVVCFYPLDTWCVKMVCMACFFLPSRLPRMQYGTGMGYGISTATQCNLQVDHIEVRGMLGTGVRCFSAECESIRWRMRMYLLIFGSLRLSRGVSRCCAHMV